MLRRLKLHKFLEDILGNKNVYFQPPASIQMHYPAIVYKLKDFKNSFANNNLYLQSLVYELILIHEDPDNEIVEKLSALPNCKFDRPFVSNNLNHYSFTLHY